MEKERLEKTVDKIALEVIKHTEAIKGLVTKEEFVEFKNENFTRLDNMMTVLQRLDQERVFTPLESPAIHSGVDSKNSVVSRNETANSLSQKDKFERGLKPRSNFLTEFTVERIRRLEEDIEKIKTHLALS